MPPSMQQQQQQTSKPDPSSYANHDVCRVAHLSMNLSVSFERHIIAGDVTLTVHQDMSLSSSSHVLMLDSRGLTINNVIDAVDDKQLKWSLGDSHDAFGEPLCIELDDTSASTPSEALTNGTNIRYIRITYETSPAASGIQWLLPSQTADKVYPYLFTQCQAIHARSLIPCQDTPGVKLTYDACITVPTAFTALMSALSIRDEAIDEGHRFYFEQKVSIPSYLLCLAVAVLERRELSSRCAVWSEASMVEKGEYEFAETEEFVRTGEALCGPYEWGRYDILLLPPSFPYGGMENPVNTFVTPTLLAGDRSLANVIAHEVCHVWMGNLVTTKTWEHFWLNEGFTVFVERKIIGRMFGGEPARQLAAIEGWKALTDSVETFGAESPLTALCPSLDGVDPDDAFSSVPYEKGHALLFYLEQLLGGPAVFEPYLKAHVLQFRGKSITTQEWKSFFLSFFKKEASAGTFDCVDWDAWFFAPGMPPVTLEFDDTLAKPCIALADRWSVAISKGMDAVATAGFSAADIDSLSSKQLIVFLEKVIMQAKKVPLVEDHILAFAAAYPTIANSCNSEIRFRWITLSINAGHKPAYHSAVEFLKLQGRMKFVRPLYRLLYSKEDGRELAVATFKEQRSSYHNICQSMVSVDLKLK